MGNKPVSAKRRILHALVPEHYRPLVRALWNAFIGTLFISRGFLTGRKIEPSASAASAQSPLAATSNGSQNPLEEYFFSHTEGRGIWKWKHYFKIYHQHFSKFIGQEVRILEVGIYSGGSLEMWKQYFGPKCVVYGIDIEKACKAYEEDGVKIYIGDQADRSFWRRFKAEVEGIDILVDDGGHIAYQQIATFEEMFPHLRPGGVYLCEDVLGAFNPFHSYVLGLTHNLNAYSDPPNPLQRIVNSVHLYPFVTVVERSLAPVKELIAPRKGTQWQPFL